jgi:Ca-activated chloride channel family protein
MKSLLKFLSALSVLSGLLCACSFTRADDSVRVRIDVDRPLVRSNCPERVVLKVCLDGVHLPRSGQRPPINLALVIDRSGSMTGTKLAKAREAAIEVVRRLSPEDVFSLVAYESEVRTLIPARHVRDRAEMEEVISSIQAGGGTALFGGVSQGANELRRHLGDSRYVSRVILLSDGQANVGPSSTQELSRLGTALMKEGISVTTVGLGLGFNEDLMTGLANCSDGNTYFVESGSDLPRIFNSELGDVLDVVARRVVVTIDFPEGVLPVRFVGRTGTINGNRAEFSLNQLYGGQEKYALLEVELAPGMAGDVRRLAEARVNCEDVRNQRSLSLRAEGKVSFSSDEMAMDKAINQKVQTDYAVNVIAVAKDAAVKHADEDRIELSAFEVRAQAKAVLALPGASSNSALKAEAAAALKEADRLERDGMDNAKRKSYRASNSQTTNQQGSR